MNELIDKEAFSKAAQLDKYGVGGLAKLLMGSLKLNKINALYEKLRDKNDVEFIDRLLDELGVQFSISDTDVANIPASGAAIVVSNHPLGGVDGLILIKALTQKRSDVKVMANFMLSSIEPINKYLISVNPYALSRELKPNYKGLREAKHHVDSGGLLCIFPAGGVSAYDIKSQSVRDLEWQVSALKFIRSAKLPVVPVSISGSNSTFFHLLGIINPSLRSLRLPSELFNKRDKHIAVRIGKSISLAEQKEFTDIFEYGRYLRTRTYLLGKPISVKAFFRPVLFKKKSKTVVLARDVEALKIEIEHLREDGQLLHESKEYQVFWAQTFQIPNMLYEIGRQREITFREVGEGTGKKIDLDEFDLYYRHLFIWDTEQCRLVGAYRLGMGRDIMERYGKRGFYLNTLFRLKRGFYPVLEESIELGRSFVVKDYQLKPLSLYLLWKGILYYILKNPSYRYLIGPVTISGEFSEFSKYLIISFIKEYYFDNELAALVKPRKEYIPVIDPVEADMSAIKKITKEDLKKLEKIIEDIELGHFRLPALLKKYLGQNAQIIAFNVDPDFNNALDGLLVMDMFNVPNDTIEGLAKEMNDKEALGNFPGKRGVERVSKDER